VLLVEQLVVNALAISDRAYVMRRGRIVMEGLSKDLLGRIDEIESNYLAAVDHHGSAESDQGFKMETGQNP